MFPHTPTGVGGYDHNAVVVAVGKLVYVQLSAPIGEAAPAPAPYSMRRQVGADDENGCNAYLPLCCDHIHTHHHVPSLVLEARETVSLGCAGMRVAQTRQVSI